MKRRLADERIAEIGSALRVESDSRRPRQSLEAIVDASSLNEIEASVTVENYMKTTLKLAALHGSDWVTPRQLTVALGVTAGSVTAMLKTLARCGLADYKRYEGIRLTKKGLRLATRVTRRHRIIETFLVQMLNFTWDQVHVEAERIEHALTDRVVDRLDELLGHPLNDPHGDPIPASDGRIPEDLTVNLGTDAVASGSRFQIVRVIDQEPTFLQFLSSSGVAIGLEGFVVSIEPTAGTVQVRVDGRPLVLSQVVAAKLRVKLL